MTFEKQLLSHNKATKHSSFASSALNNGSLDFVEALENYQKHGFMYRL